MLRLEFLKVQKGFTLLETLIAVAILGAIGVAFITAVDTNNRGIRTSQEKIVASNLAADHIEVIRELPFTTDNYSENAAILNIDRPFQYDVHIDQKFSDDGETWSDNSANKTLQRIIVSVSREGRPVFSMCTYKSE